MRTMLTFEDVLLTPKYSDIASRADIDISQEFLDMKFDLPIISANMDYVTESGMAGAMIDNGGFYVLHRFYPEIEFGAPMPAPGTFWDEADLLVMNGRPISVSVGVRNPDEELDKIKRLAQFGGGILDTLTVTVDVAHGHHQRVADMVKRLKDYGVPRVIAGNVATVRGYQFLFNAGADAVKVGIGPGSACTTREVTGVGIPQMSAIMEINTYRRNRVPFGAELLSPSIIADGGMKSSGDIVKALAAGADMVMLGSLLAGTDEAPGEQRVDRHGRVWRPYNGQSIFGVNASHYTPEGVEGWVEAKGPVKDVLQRLGAGIRSGCSYVGARNLQELREKAEFIQVTQAAYQIESAVRVSVD